MCAEQRSPALAGAPDRCERSPFVTSVSVDEGEFNAESYEPSAERSLRISRCKARMRENGKRREDVSLLTPKLV